MADNSISNYFSISSATKEKIKDFVYINNQNISTPDMAFSGF